LDNSYYADSKLVTTCMEWNKCPSRRKDWSDTAVARDRHCKQEVRDLLPSGKFGTGLASIDAMHKIGRVHSNIDRINESFFTGDRRKFGENLGEIFPDSEYNTDDEESPVVIASRTVVVNAPLEIAYQVSAFIRRQRKANAVDQDDIPAMNNAINSILDSITKFELMFVVCGMLSI